MKHVELLAPAGNMAALHAAVTAGADAVYLGLESFNARRNADNFTLETLAEACSYAHLRGVRVYVTMNTMILPGEVGEALECIRQAYRAGADAFIVQDIGLAEEIHRTLPDAGLHFSTQMNTHNLAGIRAAARLGAHRITLARELSVPEIALLCAAAEEEGIQIEVFAHGALCVCYSGQCFMSSMIGGRSANRGTCAQACRLPYELHNRALQKDLPSPGEHLLSPQDLCTIDLMEELVDVGVSSLKIEGRMKSPEYVSAVVSVYRKQLDYVLAQRAAAEGAEAEDTEAEDTEAESLEGESADRVGAECESADGAGADRTSAGCEGVQVEAAGGEGAEGEAADGEGVECEGAEVADAEGAIFEPVNDTDRARLTEAFSRGFTTAYLEGNRGNSMMSYQRPNNRGLFLGRVAEIKNGAALLKPTQELSVGDVLEFWTRKGNGVLTLSAVEQASKGLVRIPLDAKTRMVKAGDRVFRVRSAAAAFEDDAREPRVPVFGHATLKLGEPLSIEFALDPQSRAGRRLAPLFPEGLPTGFAQGVEVEAARTRAVSAEDAAAHIDRLGSTPFVLAGLTLDIDEGIGVGFSALHKVRAKALEALEAALLTARQMRKLPRVAPKDSLPAVHPSGCKIAVTVTNPACARAAKRAGAHLIYVPALNYRRGEAVIAGQLNAGAEQAGYPKGCIPIIPVVNHEEVGSAREAQVSAEVWKYVSAGKPFMAESLASLQRGSEEEAIIEVGPHLPLTNKLGLETACEFGARRVWLSPELNLKQLEELACDAPVDLGVLLIGAQELMVTEHCMLMSQGPCDEECAVCSRRKSPHYLKDRKGYEFPVITDAMGRSHMYNAVELDIASAMPELLAAGISSYMIDATLMNVEQTAQAVGRALRALHVAQNDGNAIAKMPNTTAGHLYRGVS